MGQLFNRIKRLARSYIHDSDIRRANRVIDEKDNDLKKIIDELNREKARREDYERSEDRRAAGNASGRGGDGQNTRKPYENQAMTAERACAILGVAPNAGAEQIKSAYKQKIREYHPDRVASLGAELRELAEKKTQEINTAYAFLRKVKGL